LEQGLPFGLLLALGLAELHVEAVRSVAQGDRLARCRIHPQELGAFEVGARDRVGFGIDDAELAREAALRIVRAADEGAELAELQPQSAVAAGRALARALATVVVGREEVRAELLVELVQDVADAQLFRLADGVGECLPEVTQDLAPVDAAARDIVELVLEMSGEVVFDVARKVGLQERRDDAAAILRYEALALQPHIAALLQHLDDRRIGRWPADAELLELLDEARLAVAPRRLH